MNYQLYNFIRGATVDQLADIALKMIAEHPDTFQRLANINQANEFIVPISGQRVVFDDAQVFAIRGISQINKIDRIKKVREITQLGLVEAKNLVESQAFIDYFN